MQDHFRTAHHLCEEGECIDQQFTNAFRTELDLQSHRAKFHMRGMSKSQIRQARTLDIDINLRPRTRKFS